MKYLYHSQIWTQAGLQIVLILQIVLEIVEKNISPPNYNFAVPSLFHLSTKFHFRVYLTFKRGFRMIKITQLVLVSYVADVCFCFKNFYFQTPDRKG